jgi:hypothetical protein
MDDFIVSSDWLLAKTFVQEREKQSLTFNVIESEQITVEIEDAWMRCLEIKRKVACFELNVKPNKQVKKTSTLD